MAIVGAYATRVLSSSSPPLLSWVVDTTAAADQSPKSFSCLSEREKTRLFFFSSPPRVLAFCAERPGAQHQSRQTRRKAQCRGPRSKRATPGKEDQRGMDQADDDDDDHTCYPLALCAAHVYITHTHLSLSCVIQADANHIPTRRTMRSCLSLRFSSSLGSRWRR